MEVRQMATAFLFNGNRVLMMRKSSSRFIDEEFWSGLGGHMEEHELNFPKKACYREIYEESGFKERDIEELKLRYVLLRIKEQEIRQQFVYFGETARLDFVNSDEGELHWIDIDKILTLRLSKIIEFMVGHYLQDWGRDNVTIGTITWNDAGEPAMQWSELKDPGVF